MQYTTFFDIKAVQYCRIWINRLLLLFKITTRSLNSKKISLLLSVIFSKVCLKVELNHWHVDFQSTALPTELLKRFKAN